MGIIKTLINPVKWIKAYRFQKKNAKFDKSSYDLELFLYSKILSNDMLHYGYFEDTSVEPDRISIKDFEDAQIRYAQNIIDQISNVNGKILDVGCGMGGLSAMMLNKGYQVEALTPNKNQKQHIDSKYPNLVCHNMKFEDLIINDKYATIINSESLQYINLNTAFEKIDQLLEKNGRWIVVDYFRTSESAKKPHLQKDFVDEISKRNWKIVFEKDISMNVLPTLKLVSLYANRFFIPLKHFAFEKLRYKKAWIYYLTEDLRISISNKINKEMKTIDPENFLKERKYVFYVVER